MNNIIHLAEYRDPVIPPLHKAQELNAELVALAMVDEGRLSDSEIHRRTGIHHFFIRSYRDHLARKVKA